MHKIITNLNSIKEELKTKIVDYDKLNIIAVSKTFSLNQIQPLIDHGHLHYGENKVQEALEKWSEIKKTNNNIKLHMIGKLQSNKVKFAVKLFDYIHSVDSEKLANKIASEEIKVGRKLKIFVQVNIGDEQQKSGINKNEIKDLILFCKDIKLNLIGLMCIPPDNKDPTSYFKEMSEINRSFGFSDLSMGMSSDYLNAARNSATYLRIGSSIFGPRD